MEICLPKRIYQYEILDLVGQGKNGALCKGRDSASGSTVAVKLLHPHVSADAEFQSRCLPQLKAARGLSHPGIATLYDVIEHEDQVLLVSEFIDGVSLDSTLQSGPMSLQDFLNIADQMARGLDHLHTNGLIHGDIQPSNIMITSNGRVKLTDFGLPRRLADSNLTLRGFRPGTAVYASPEEAQEEQPTNASDLFSLGIVFYEMLGGKPPFPGESVEELLRQIFNYRPDFVLISRYHVPGEIVLLLKRLLSVKTDERCTEVSELLATLEAEHTLQRELSERDETGLKPQSVHLYLLISLLAVLMVLMWSIIAEYR
ncbi:MAG: serine/threonine protein kinase [candidate division Zixibacteria bacterium]|nr:serine/threonine protein kinase [candidate division Zixibacteria bacterium]